MAETYPDDADLNALSGTSEAIQEVYYPAIAEKPHYLAMYKTLSRLLSVALRAGDLRVYKDGDLTFGVRAGRFNDGDTARSYAGSTENALTDDATNYIYLAADGTLTVNTTGYPDPSATPHVPLATIETADGAFDLADITDHRGRAFLAVLEGPSPTARAVADPGDAGAIPVDACGVCPIVTDGGAETRTLDDPTFAGQVLTLAMKTDGGDAVITADSAVNQAGNNTITMDDPGDTVFLVGVEIGAALAWRVVVNDGCTLSTVP